MNDGTEPILSVKDMSIRFGGLVAVTSMTFDVRPGEVLSLIGPNGAGKTSAFNAITGYLRPSSGDVVYQGQRLNGLSPDAVSRLGLVRTFQKTSLFGGLSAFQNVLIGLHKRSTQRPLAIMLGLASVRADERRLEDAAREVLDFIELSDRAGEQAAALPYGEQRLLEVAIALAAEPKLLLLDEPVSGMNPAEKARFMATLARIRARGITVLLVEHDMRTVMGASDRVVCLNQGHIIANGTPEEIQRNKEVIKAYLGERSTHARH
jgi:branched-chain amino acid transport system ATP-binding protein